MQLSDIGNSIRSGRRLRRPWCVSGLIGALLFFTLALWAQQENDARVTQIPSGPYRIAGTVVNAKTGSPLARARVTIDDTKQRQSVQSTITGDDGRYEFHVPSGKYSLGGAKRGFVTASYNQHDQYSTAIVTASDLDTESLVLRLQPNAVLSGRVFDEFQEPVRNAQVMLYYEDNSQGVTRITRAGNAMTNDGGRYEITPLRPGTYFVAVKATPWYAVHPESGGDGSEPPSNVDGALDVAYPITYYGDTMETESAIPIPVRGGDHLEADVHLTPVPALHFLILAPREQSTGVVHIPQLQKATFDGLEDENPSVRQISDGLFELSGIPAGRYTVKMPESNGSAREASDVDLTSGGELDVGSGSLTSTVKIKVQIAGATSLPQLLWIGLRGTRNQPSTVQVDDKGEVTLSDVKAGKYDVVARSRTQMAYSVTRIASESGTIAGHTLTVPAGASLNLSVTLVGGSVTINGLAKRDGKASAGAMIVLVPKEADADRSRFRRDQSDLDGSFTLPNVIPGSYTVVAIDDGWDLNWSEPAVLAPYLAHGQAVEVGDRATRSMQLPEAVPVQGK